LSPDRLQRFLDAQKEGGTYGRALAELRAGRKRGHWMWFVFPQIAGLGHSAMAQTYAIASLEEARAYAAHPVLGERLRECARVLLGLPGDDARAIFGELDAVKLRSSMTLFARAAPQEPLIGAFNDEIILPGGEPSPPVGAAYVFTRSGSTWAQSPKLIGGGEEAGEGAFGSSVALSSDANTALIGGPSDNGGVGAAWLFSNPASPAVVPAPAPVPVSQAAIGPILTKVIESNRTWREGKALAAIASKVKLPPIGTTFSFSLNEQASVHFAFTQQLGGRKVKGKCVTQTKSNRRDPACKRTVTQGTLSFTGRPAANKVSFQGRISRSKTLGLGRYTLVLTASNAAGQHSTPVQLSFTIEK